MSETKAAAKFAIVELYDPLGSWRIDRTGRLMPIPLSQHRRRDTADRAWRRQCCKLRGQQVIGFAEYGYLIRKATRDPAGKIIIWPVMPRE